MRQLRRLIREERDLGDVAYENFDSSLSID
jgi:hypothetical protein